MSNVVVLAAVLLFAPAPRAWFKEQMTRAEQDRASGEPARIQRAKERYLEMADFAARTGDVDWTVYSAWRQACCDHDLGRYDAAEAALLDLMRSSPKSGLLVYLHRDLGEFYLDSDQPLLAKKHLEQALTLPQSYTFLNRSYALSSSETLRIRQLKARSLVAALDNAGARKELEAIQDALKQIPNGAPEESAWMFVDSEMLLAELDRRDSDTPGAITRFKACLDKLSGFDSPQSAQREVTCHLQAVTDFSRLTRFADAKSELAAAERYLVDHPGDERRRKEVDGTRLFLEIESIRCDVETDVRAPILLERLDAAKRLATRILDDKTHRARLPKHEAAIGHNSLANILALEGRVLDALDRKPEALSAYKAARSEIDESINLFTNALGRKHDALIGRRLRAELSMKLGDLPGARKEIGDVLAELTKRYGPQHVDCALCHRLLIDIESRAGNIPAAKVHAQAHRQLANDRLLAYATGLTAAEQQTFFRRWNDPGLQSSLRLGASHRSLWEASSEWLLNGKAKTSEVLAEVNRRARGSESARRLQRVLEDEAYVLFGSSAGNNAFRLLSDEKEKRDLAGQIARKIDSRWWTLSQLQRSLTADEAYIDVVCINDESDAHRTYYAWVIPQAAPVSVVRLGSAEQIDPLVRKLFDRLQAFANDQDDPAIAKDERRLRDECLEPLSKLVFEPIQQAAAGKRRWIVSPDGSLWNLSWAALLLPKTKNYAVTEITFSYVISGRDVLARGAAPARLGPPVVIADPEFNLVQPGGKGRFRMKSSLIEQVAPLFAARKEGVEVVDCLARLTKDPKLENQVNATKDVLLELQDPPRILYLATHAFFIRPSDAAIDDPFLRCGVMLAGFNWLPDKSPGQPARLIGLLTGAEVLLANLQGTELVVLSGCETGIGLTSYGHGAASLRHAFHLAGAKAVVASLWSVEDRATKLLMLSLMNEPALLTDNAKALTEAQRTMIDQLSQNRRHAHPFYWAGLTLSGF